MMTWSGPPCQVNVWLPSHCLQWESCSTSLSWRKKRMMQPGHGWQSQDAGPRRFARLRVEVAGL
eukprot:5822203-Lingulodinium_polyedra.AAC.1